MNRQAGFRILMAAEFSRTEKCAGSTPIRVDYRFSKMTPFGVMEAVDSVTFSAFLTKGPEFMDAHMLDRLSQRLNREETERYVETSANVDFGETSAA